MLFRIFALVVTMLAHLIFFIFELYLSLFKKQSGLASICIFAE